MQPRHSVVLQITSRFSAPVLLAAVLYSVAARGEMLVLPSDWEMLHSADAVIVGTVTGVGSEFDIDGRIVSNIDVHIERALHGPVATGQTIRIVEPGGIVGSQAMVVSPAPTYWKENRALIFLIRTESGAWRTWGAPLGKFDFVRDSTGRVLAVRWALQSETISTWSQDGHPAEDKLRDSEPFLDYIFRAFSLRRKVEAVRRGRLATDALEPDYFVEPAPDRALTEPYAWNPETNATYPPSAYTEGTFRWRVFDDGGFVTYRASGSQPGYDSTGAAQRALAAWTNDPGSNVDIRYGGTTTAGFVGDGINAIVFNNSTAVPAGAIAYAQWSANGTHTYKGETFYSISEGDVVVKSNLSVTQKVFDEAVTHEVGHTLGFRHSDQGTPSSTQAVMKAVLSGAYGATLGPWDIEAVRTVYESATSVVLPPAPAGLGATATSATRVQLTWGLSTGATSYKVERSSNNGGFVEIATTVTNSYADTSVSPGVTYVYRVRAVNAAGNSNYSNRDHATTIMFTDDPLVAGTPIKAVHILQLRQAVNAMRAAAGLAPATWTDPSLTGVTVKAVHITQLRAALAPALTALGKPSPAFTDPSLTPGMPIRAVHIQELRNYVK